MMLLPMEHFHIMLNMIPNQQVDIAVAAIVLAGLLGRR